MSTFDHPLDVDPADRCEECKARARESRLAPGHFYIGHRGDCSQNSALQVCERCGNRHADLDFGQMLACTMEMSLDEGREMQQRIVARIERTWLSSEDPNG